jgi:hypothetical protein
LIGGEEETQPPELALFQGLKKFNEINVKRGKSGGFRVGSFRAEMPAFARTMGVDYSSAKTPTANRADEDRNVGLGSVLRLYSDALPRLAGLRDGHFDGTFFGVPALSDIRRGLLQRLHALFQQRQSDCDLL